MDATSVDVKSEHARLINRVSYIDFSLPSVLNSDVLYKLAKIKEEALSLPKEESHPYETEKAKFDISIL